MKKGIYKFIATFLFTVTSITIVFAENKTVESDGFNPTPYILHHIADSYEWHLWGSVSIPLPVILYTDGHIDIFMSSLFDHGHAEVERGERTYTLDSHGHVVEKSGLAVYDFSITKNVAAMFVSLILLLFLFISAGRIAKKSFGKTPSGLLAFLEPLVVFVRDDIIIPNMGVKHHKKYLPYLMTVFFFIFINNLLGLVPGGANVTGNIAVALVLSFLTLIITNLSGNKNYWKHIFLPNVPLALYPLMVPIEVVGVLTKPFALMIRLFANITAGHIIILSLISLIFVFESLFVAPVSVGFVLFMNTLELLVAALQAYIFTLLSALFIGQAVQEHH